MPGSSSRPREEAPVEDVRDRIVASALRCFAEKGYAGTSLREIAEAARTTKPMIYYYFTNKEGLYISTLGSLLQEFADAIDQATHADDPPVEKLRSFCDAYLRYFESQEPHIAFVVREVFGLGVNIMHEFGRRLDERIHSRLKRILEEGVDQGCFRAGDVDACTIAIMGILIMFILRRVFRGVELDRDAAVAQVIEYYIAGLRMEQMDSVHTAVR